MHALHSPTRILRIVLILSLMTGLLLSSCASPASLDLQLDGQSGSGNFESTLFTVTILLFLAMAALVLVAGRV